MKRPRTIVAVLGASNVTLALPQIVRALLDRQDGGRADYFIAHGPGRSYGTIGGVAGIRFAALNSCGLYRHLEECWRSSEQPAVYALLTDVGNDVVYGAGVKRIRSWILDVVKRLEPLRARIAITSLPVESVLRIPSWKYRLVRPLLYPGRPMLRRDVFTRVVQLQDAVEELGRDRHIQILPSRAEWYAFDHIHVAKRWRQSVFTRWLDALFDGESPADDGATRALARPDDGAAAPSPAQCRGTESKLSPLRLRLRRPRELYLGSLRLEAPQQGIEVGTGARLFLY